MTLFVLLANFWGGLALITTSAWVLVTLIGRVGARFHFTVGLLGVAVALGADSPESASAVTALLAGNAELGVGVDLGSNLYNIAALLGVSAIMAPKGLRLRPARRDARGSTPWIAPRTALDLGMGLARAGQRSVRAVRRSVEPR